MTVAAANTGIACNCDLDQEFALTRVALLHYLKAYEMGICVLLYDVANCRHALLQCNIFFKPAGISVV